MKRYIFIITICLLFFTNANGQQHQFTLEQCLQYALGNNYNRQSLKLTEQTTENTYEQSKLERLPDLNATLSENFSNTQSGNSSMSGNVGLNTSVTIYNGGNIGNAIEQNKLKMEQSAWQTSQYENELTIQILRAFLTVLGNEELLKYQEAVLIASEEQLKQGIDQYRLGKILESDYLMLEAQYASDKNNIVDTQIARENGLLALKSLLSIDPSESLEIIPPNVDAIEIISLLPSQQIATERAMANLPDLKILQYNIDIADVGIKLAKADLYPTVSLGGSLGTSHYNYSSFGSQFTDNFNQRIGVSVSIPIYSKGRTQTRITQSKIALQQAELNQRQSEINIRQTVIQAHQNVVSTYNKYKATDIKQNAYHKTFQAYTAQFNVGSITAVTLLQQQNNYIGALNDFIQSKYSFILNRKILDVYMGERIAL